MKKILTVGLMMLGLFAASAQAGEVCDTIEECEKLETKLEARQAELQKDVTPELTGVLRTRVYQQIARRTCAEKDMRLPTARELALVAQSLGAQGISETKKYGYYLVKGSDRAGNPDYFYYSPKGYKRPVGALGRKSFWSSSIHPQTSRYAYRLIGKNGVIHDAHRLSSVSHGDISRINAVRCVRSR